MVDASVQTEIQDIRFEFIQVEPNIILIQKKAHQVSNQQFFQPPPIYYPNTYQNLDFSTTTTISPPYPPSPYGWWTGVSQSGL